MTHSSNTYLTPQQMKDNAQFILDYLMVKGWSANAIFGMLGNMQTESTINPGIFQNLDFGNMTDGFGLVQWTPATKYIEWAESQGYLNYEGYGKLIPQLERLEYERQNNIQWIHSSISFTEFSRSNDTPYNLAMLFITAYERPAEPNQPLRGQQAEYWANVLDVSGGGQQPHPPTEMNKVFISYPFGPRTNPVTGLTEFHRGTDWAPSTSDYALPIYAVQSGIIRERGFGNLRGNYIVIEHTGDPYTSLYFHMSNLTGGLVVGSMVSWGQQIGTMGNTGSSSGTHLHLGISTVYPEWYDGDDGAGSFIDAEIYLNMRFGISKRKTISNNIIYWGKSKLY